MHSLTFDQGVMQSSFNELRSSVTDSVKMYTDES